MNWTKPTVRRNGIAKQDRISIAEIRDNEYLKIEWVGRGKTAYALSTGTFTDKKEIDRGSERLVAHFPSVKAAKEAAEEVSA